MFQIKICIYFIYFNTSTIFCLLILTYFLTYLLTAHYASWHIEQQQASLHSLDIPESYPGLVVCIQYFCLCVGSFPKAFTATSHTSSIMRLGHIRYNLSPSQLRLQKIKTMSSRSICCCFCNNNILFLQDMVVSHVLNAQCLGGPVSHVLNAQFLGGPG